MAVTARAITNVAKISRPNMSGIFPRTRLYQILDDNKYIPIIWITSPPGAGKTTLISHYLQEKDLTTIWYQMDVEDYDLSTFFYYLGQATKKASPRKRKDLPLLTPDYQRGIPIFTRNFFRELFSRFSKPVAVVFDNYHEVNKTAKLHQMLATGLQEIPENARVFIISRTEPPPEFTRLRANSQVVLLDWEYLKITDEEMHGLLSVKGLAKKTTHKIMQLTQGWMAGLILLLEQKNIDEWSIDKEAFNPKLLFDYFAGEVFQDTTQEIQDFLVKTALFPKMTLEMAAQLTGIKQPVAIFDYLVSRNYFTYQHMGKTKLYEYHPLFREFLLKKFNDNVSDVEATVIKWRAAELLQVNNQVEPAVALLADVHDWKKLSELINSSAKTLLEQGRNHTLKDWIFLIPETVRKNCPWLLFWLGEVYSDTEPGKSWPFHEQAFYQFESQQDVAGIYMSLSGVLYSIRNEHDGDVRRIDPWLEKLEQIRKIYPDIPSLEIEARVGMYVFTALWWRHPHEYPDMDYWRERVLQIAPQITWGSRARLWVNLIKAFHLLFIGEPIEAKYLLDNIKKETIGLELPPMAQIWFQISSGLYHWRAGYFKEALENYEKGLQIGKQSGTHIEDYQLCVLAASVALNIEDFPLAEHYINQLEPVDRGVKGSRYHHINAWYDYALGDSKKAVLHAKKSLELAKASGAPFFIGLSCCTLAIAYYCDEDFEQANTILNAFNQFIQNEYNSNLFKHSYYNLNALIQFRRGHESIGIENLKEGFLIGKQCEYCGSVYISKKEMSYLYAKAISANVETKYVQKIVRALNLKPGPEAMGLDNWPWKIEIFGFDHCELKKDGEPISFSRKFPKKVMQLVGVMVANGGENVAEEKIIESLWPDAEGDAGHKAFNTTLHRLRKIFGNDAIQLSEGRLSFNHDLVWGDICTFENILQRAEQLKDSESIEEKKKLMEKALTLYRGHFLGDSSASWAIPARERLRNKYLSTVEDYGLLLESETNWNEAIKWYQKGLEMDILAEQFYQRLMYCYEQLDRRGDAVEVYRQCYRVMVASLGVEPSVKTKEIYNTVRAA